LKFHKFQSKEQIEMKANSDVESRSPELKAAKDLLVTTLAELTELRQEKAERESKLMAGKQPVEEQAQALLAGHLYEESATLVSEIEELDRSIAYSRTRHRNTGAKGQPCP
jgi:hypothetical protein